MGIIYRLTFPNGKQYIGLTTQTLKCRLRNHRSSANIGRGGLLYSAIRKYGPRSFNAEEIANSDNFEALKELEKAAIKAHGCRCPNGYNLTDGGDGVLGVVISEATRKKRSESQKRSFSDPARKLRHLESQRNPEVRMARSVASKRMHLNPAHTVRMSEIMLNKWRDPSYLSKMATRRTKPKLNDGLNKSQRYRLKDLEGYRKKKRDQARLRRQLRRVA